MADRLAVLFADYAEHHRNPRNRWCHMIGIPLIAFSLLGLLAVRALQLGGVRLDWAVVLVVLLAPVYLWLDARLGTALVVAYLLLYGLARHFSWPVHLALFVLGWVFQFVGHGVYEKRSPAFFKNLIHLVVGPLWVANHLLRLRPEANS
ncbi:MAG: DUF962 domain-containing protein [Firmicutes bacterium]|nr:DUF962 domain-containing protein [Bacillota bacterium]